MSDEADVQVTIGVDASAVEPGAEAATAGVESISAAINALAAQTATQTAAIQQGFAQMAAASRATAAEIEADAEAERAGLLGVIATTREGIESFNELKESVMGFGELMIAAFAVEEITEFAKRMGEAGEQTEHTAQRLGIAVGDVQNLNAAFTMMGVSGDKGVMAIGRLDKAFASARQGSTQQIAAFKELGVSTEQNYTQMQLLGAVMDGFKNMADGPEKTAVAMNLLGRAGAQMIPFLNLGSAGLAELNRVTAEYGVQNTEAAEKAAQLGSAFNENAVAMQGVNNVLSEALAPTFTEIVQLCNSLIASFIKSYESGGLVRTIMDDIVASFQVFGSICGNVIDVIGTLFSTFSDGATKSSAKGDEVKEIIKQIGDAFAIAAAAAKTGIQVMGMLLDQLDTQLVGVGQVIGDVFTGQMGKAANDWAASQAKVRAEAAQTAQAIVADWAKATQQIQTMGEAQTKAQMETTGEGEGDTSGLAKKLAKHKSAAKDQVQVWQEALDTQIENEGNYFADSTAEELAYWQNILATEKTNTEQQIQIRAKVYSLSKALAHQQAEELKKDLDQETKDTVEAIQQQEEVRLGQLDADKTLAADRLAVEKSLQDMLVATGRATKQQGLADTRNADASEVASEIAAANAIYQVKLAALQGELDAGKDVNKQIEQLEAAHQTQMTELVAKGATQQAQAMIKAAQAADQQWTQTFDQMGQKGISTFNSLVTGQETWQQAENKAAMAVLEYFENMVVKKVSAYLAGLVTQKAADAAQAAAAKALQTTTTTTAVTEAALADRAQIAGLAAVAAAAAFAATAAIPITGPALAPAAGAAAEGQVMAYQALVPAFAGGGNVDATGLALLHTQEMVLPAGIAQGLRSAIAQTGSVGGGGAAPSASGGGSGAQVNITIQAMDGQDVQRVLTNNSGQVAMALQQIMQNGHFAGMTP